MIEKKDLILLVKISTKVFGFPALEAQSYLTLKRGGGFPPQDIRAIAVLLGTNLWLLNLHVIIIFGVYNNWKKI